MYGDTLLGCATTTNMRVTCIFHNPVFYLPHILLHCHWQCIWMSHEVTLVFPQRFIFGSGGNFSFFLRSYHILLKSNRVLSEVFWQAYYSNGVWNKKLFLCIISTVQPMLALKLCCLILCNLASSLALYFIVSHVSSTYFYSGAQTP